MRLTLHTDYALRLLIHLAASPDGRATIADVAAGHDLSRNHLMKVVNQLARDGFLATQRGRGGGFALARPAEEIMLGTVVRTTEPDMRPADCAVCAIRSACGLSGIFSKAMAAFMAVLDEHSLADAVRDKAGLAALIAAMPRPVPAEVSACGASSPLLHLG
ncbi:Rrf2 family transcriptional regulator [Sphingobium aquiterrae]|uniref:Rrf2 family transcriptional regulator n=1 Tax=Sphingobium aquiterrae TaxID=2038656 RepID=UPI0030183AF4